MSDFDELLKIQRRMQKRIMEEQRIDNTVDILMLFNELAPNTNQRLQKEKLLVEGGVRGFEYKYMEETINRLIKDRILFVPVPGYLQRR